MEVLTDPQEALRRTSTIARFADLDPNEFEAETKKIWTALADIRSTVSSHVQQENLSPVQGIAILACASGQVFGYAEFHGQPSSVDVLTRALWGPQAQQGNGGMQR